jgi:cellulose synthase/poly-beta-1,6-N-acetylglucosamine synthase-like glycosyltransferase
MERRAGGLAPNGAALPVGRPRIDHAERRALAEVPKLPDWAIPMLCASLSDQDAALAASHRLLAISSLEDVPAFAAADSLAVRQAWALGGRVVARMDGQVFGKALTRCFAEAFLDKACFGLARAKPELSASRPFRPGQFGRICAMLALVFVAMMLTPGVVLSLLALCLFLPLSALRFASLLSPAPRHDRARLSDAELPIYSVMVALHREAEVLPQLVEALSKLDYPAARLDVKLVIEADDRQTSDALFKLALPAHFEIIRVPAAQPRTKPKALNYALAFARGEFVTIYDAEDMPDPRQLRQAAEVFAAAPSNTGCLQARLAFYNSNENWLTRQFGVEYATLFDLMLPLLAWVRMPVPLGGTSNHFRTQVLRSIGGWDPFNVTEDADLGLRLARHGFFTRILASTTQEEAPSDLKTWMPQRARWLKGWIQTWVVHTREPLASIRDMGLLQYLMAQILMIGTFLAALLYPWFTASFLWTVLSGKVFQHGGGAAEFAALVANLSVFILGHGFMLAAGAEGLRRRLPRARWIVATMPLYWLMISAAAWIALWQFATNPFHWNKTPHRGMRPHNRAKPEKERHRK